MLFRSGAGGAVANSGGALSNHHNVPDRGGIGAGNGVCSTAHLPAAVFSGSPVFGVEADGAQIVGNDIPLRTLICRRGIAAVDQRCNIRGYFLVLCVTICDVSPFFNEKL